MNNPSTHDGGTNTTTKKKNSHGPQHRDGAAAAAVTGPGDVRQRLGHRGGGGGGGRCRPQHGGGGTWRRWRWEYPNARRDNRTYDRRCLALFWKRECGGLWRPSQKLEVGCSRGRRLSLAGAGEGTYVGCGVSSGWLFFVWLALWSTIIIGVVAHPLDRLSELEYSTRRIVSAENGGVGKVSSVCSCPKQ